MPRRTGLGVIKNMIDPKIIFGRLGNQMFQYATLYQYAKENNSDIYFQDPKWFEKYEDDIRKMFSEGIGFLPHVSIHIRRGDYVDNPFYVDLTKTDYYEKSIKMFPNKQFLVFSDNTKFAQEYMETLIDKKEFQVMEGTELEDFNQMASCESNVLANSSFSWWAGYLNPNPSKIVVYPKHWYSDDIPRTVCPKEWISL
jgi:hypothetical protein